MGGRLLRRWLGSPLRNRDTLARRHNAIGALLAGHRYESFREELRGVGDVERILSRIALTTARPRDLTTLRYALGVLPRLAAILDSGDARITGKQSATCRCSRNCTTCWSAPSSTSRPC